MSIKLYLIRHARAEARSDRWPDDDVRPLSDDGRERFRAAVRGLERLGVSFDYVVSSPLVRASQTAALLEPLARHADTATLDALRPGRRPTVALRALASIEGVGRMAVVGHEPGLGALLACLLGASRPVPFRKGAVACLDVPRLSLAAAGTLRWFAPPSVLRRLGR